MTDDQKKKPAAGFWITVALVALLAVGLLYTLSIGPAARMASRRQLPLETFAAIYRPIILTAYYGPKPVRLAFWTWYRLWESGMILEDAL